MTTIDSGPKTPGSVEPPNAADSASDLEWEEIAGDSPADTMLECNLGVNLIERRRAEWILGAGFLGGVILACLFKRR